jgi:hypothetical protein
MSPLIAGKATASQPQLLYIMHFVTLVAALVLSLAEPAIAQDHTSSPYVQGGIPSTSHLWTSDDYAKAARILASKAVRLPRYSNADGAELLDRVTAPENLLVYRNRSLPAAKRFAEYVEFLGSLCSIDELYVKADFSTKSQKPEVASLLAYTVRAVATGLNLFDELAATAPNAANHKAVVDAVDEMRSAVMTVFDETLAGLLEGEVTGEDRLQVLNALAETLPTMKRAFSADYKKALRSKLEADRGRSEDAEDRRLHSAMISELDS